MSASFNTILGNQINRAQSFPRNDRTQYRSSLILLGFQTIFHRMTMERRKISADWSCSSLLPTVHLLVKTVFCDSQGINWIPSEDVHDCWVSSHFQWGSAFLVSCITNTGEAHLHSYWECALPVRYMSILRGQIPIPSENDHSQWGTSPSLVSHIAIPGRDVCHRECTSLPGIGMCLNKNRDVTHR